jgi:serine/threonine-protein kinase
MSPEQAQGEKRVDHRTDLWALGVITFEAMVGRRPFEATNLGDLLVKICAQDPPKPSFVYPGVPDGFDNWFLRACARNPEERFSSAKEMAATLAILCGSIPATLSDSSYVALFQKGVPAEESEASLDRARRAPEDTPAVLTVRDPTPSAAENEPTQVMTDLPAGMIEEDGIPISIGPEEFPIVPTRMRTLPPRVMIDSSIPTKLRTSSSAPPIANPEDEEEDPVEMFDAADVAKNMAAVRQELRRAEAKKQRHELARRYGLPVMAIAIAIVIAAAYLLLR